MRIDFHHGATHLCARMAGFAPCGAEIIADSAQYVDDAHESGMVCFDNDFCYKQTASEYCLLSYQQKGRLLNRHNNLAFYCLLGHCGQSTSSTTCLSPHANKWILRFCCPSNSLHIHNKILDAIRPQNKTYARYWLDHTGLPSMDSWANPKFSGFLQHGEDITRNIDFALQSDLEKICATLEYIGPDKAENRCSIGRQRITSGEFGLSKKTSSCHEGKFNLKYQAPGKDTPSPAHYWHHNTLRVLRNHRKRFHDVVQAHTLFVLNELLPQYGLMAV